MKQDDITKILIKDIKSLYVRLNETDNLKSCLGDYGRLKLAFNNEIERQFFFGLPNDVFEMWNQIVTKMEEFIKKPNVVLRKRK